MRLHVSWINGANVPIDSQVDFRIDVTILQNWFFMVDHRQIHLASIQVLRIVLIDPKEGMRTDRICYSQQFIIIIELV